VAETLVEYAKGPGLTAQPSGLTVEVNRERNPFPHEDLPGIP